MRGPLCLPLLGLEVRSGSKRGARDLVVVSLRTTTSSRITISSFFLLTEVRGAVGSSIIVALSEASLELLGAEESELGRDFADELNVGWSVAMEYLELRRVLEPSLSWGVETSV